MRNRVRGRGFATLALVAAALTASSAQAHSPVPGIEGFYLGLVHPLTAPAQLLALLGLGVLTGLLFPARYALLGGMFAAAFLTALALPLPDPWLDTGLFALAALAGTAAALLPRQWLFWAAAALSAVTGAGLGLASIPDPGPATDRAVTMAGSAAGANLALLYLAGGIGWMRDRVRRPWVTIALRVAAAWIAAIAGLMAALAASGVEVTPAAGAGT
jgi:hypothetical protein